jgi:hypothetical protein
MMALVALMAASMAAVVIPASPAAARSTPECESYAYPYNQLGYMVAAPIGKYGVLPCSLVWGDGGPGTGALQEALNDCYLAPARKTLLVEDGSFGAKTYEALRYAQGIAKVTVDGQFGPLTRAALKYPALTRGTSTCARLR